MKQVKMQYYRSIEFQPKRVGIFHDDDDDDDDKVPTFVRAAFCSRMRLKR